MLPLIPCSSDCVLYSQIPQPHHTLLLPAVTWIQRRGIASQKVYRPHASRTSQKAGTAINTPREACEDNSIQRFTANALRGKSAGVLAQTPECLISHMNLKAESTFPSSAEESLVQSFPEIDREEADSPEHTICHCSNDGLTNSLLRCFTTSACLQQCSTSSRSKVGGQVKPQKYVESLRALLHIYQFWLRENTQAKQCGVGHRPLSPWCSSVSRLQTVLQRQVRAGDPHWGLRLEVIWLQTLPKQTHELHPSLSLGPSAHPISWHNLPGQDPRLRMAVFCACYSQFNVTQPKTQAMVTFIKSSKFEIRLLTKYVIKHMIYNHVIYIHKNSMVNLKCDKFSGWMLNRVYLNMTALYEYNTALD